jgi:hypothetical protein
MVLRDGLINGSGSYGGQAGSAGIDEIWRIDGRPQTMAAPTGSLKVPAKRDVLGLHRLPAAEPLNPLSAILRDFSGHETLSRPHPAMFRRRKPTPGGQLSVLRRH